MSKKENLLASLLINIAIPTLILLKLNIYTPALTLTTALLFPLIYAARDALKNKKLNYVSAIGFTSILLTGGIGLLKLSPEWLAVKEASIPLVIAVIIYASKNSKNPLIETLLSASLDLEKARKKAGKKKHLINHGLKQSTNLLAIAFLISAILNYALAKIIVTAPSGTEFFNQQLGKMTAVSYPVILIPMLAILVIITMNFSKTLRKAAKIEIEKIMK